MKQQIHRVNQIFLSYVVSGGIVVKLINREVYCDDISLLMLEEALPV